jgi:hypothetical protein
MDTTYRIATMGKAIIPILSALAVLAGCSKSNVEPSQDFTHTGCAKTRAGAPDDDELSLVILQYEDGNLRVTRTNATVNCSVNDRGLACRVQVEGNVIQYVMDYEKDGPDAKCLCKVEKMTSLVTGLEKGKEYTFKYWGIDSHIDNYSFTFDKDLHQIIDLNSLIPPGE